MTSVTCGLTAEDWDKLRIPTLVSSMVLPLPSRALLAVWARYPSLRRHPMIHSDDSQTGIQVRWLKVHCLNHALIRATVLLLHYLHILSPFQRPFSRWTWVRRYQNVCILDFIGAEGDGGGGNNWICKTQSSSQIFTTNKPTPIFLQTGCPSCRSISSGKALKGKCR